MTSTKHFTLRTVLILLLFFTTTTPSIKAASDDEDDPPLTNCETATEDDLKRCIKANPPIIEDEDQEDNNPTKFCRARSEVAWCIMPAVCKKCTQDEFKIYKANNLKKNLLDICTNKNISLPHDVDHYQCSDNRILIAGGAVSLAAIVVIVLIFYFLKPKNKMKNLETKKSITQLSGGKFNSTPTNSTTEKSPSLSDGEETLESGTIRSVSKSGSAKSTPDAT